MVHWVGFGMEVPGLAGTSLIKALGNSENELMELERRTWAKGVPDV